MNKTLPYSEPLIGRAIAGKQHPVFHPENAIDTAKKSSILLLSDTLEPISCVFLISKNTFIQYYQWFQKIINDLSGTLIGAFCDQFTTNLPPICHHLFTKEGGGR